MYYVILLKALYFSCWLPFLPHDTLGTAVYNASCFLTVLASVTSRTGLPRCVSPLSTNSDESYGTVIHQVAHCLLQHVTFSCKRRDT